MDSKYHFGETGAGELIPGAVPRRWEPEQGIGKLNNRIHKENSTSGRNLPYSFGKALKPLSGQAMVVKCNNCGHISRVNTATVGVICSKCKKFSGVTKIQ